MSTPWVLIGWEWLAFLAIVAVIHAGRHPDSRTARVLDVLAASPIGRCWEAIKEAIKAGLTRVIYGRKR